MIRTILSILIVCLGLTGPAPAARAQDPAGSALEIGVFPYLSTRTLLATYQPLQRFLEQRLARPVVIVTASDMRTFVERTLAGAYPFVVTAPHFARLAQTQSGYRPLLRAQRDLAGLIVVARDSPMRSLADLKGKTLATPDDLAIVSRLALDLLRQHGLKPLEDLSVEEMPSHNAALQAVRQGAVAAAAVSNTAFEQVTGDQQQNFRVLATTASVPHVMILARRDVPAGEAGRFIALLQEFVQKTPEGEQFLKKLGYLGLRPPTEGELRSLDPYTEGVRAALHGVR